MFSPHVETDTSDNCPSVYADCSVTGLVQSGQSLEDYDVLQGWRTRGEVLSTHAEPDTNNNYLSVYTNYDTAASAVCSNLEFALCRRTAPTPRWCIRWTRVGE